VFNAFWDNDHFAACQGFASVAKIHIKLSVENDEDLVHIVVLMPDKIPFYLHQLDVVVVEFGDDFGSPVFIKLVKLLVEIDFLHAQSLTASIVMDLRECL